METSNRYLDIAIEAARQAGRYQREQFGITLEYDYKSSGDPISRIDHESERLILDRLTAAFPDHAILSEERGTIGSGENRWIVDPLDGTSNYVRGIPDFAVSIALEVDDRLHTGVIYRPMSDDLYAATLESDGVVSEESTAIGVSETNALENALVSVPYSSACTDRAAVWETHRALGSNVEGLRSSGSGALDLAYLAAGRTDAACGFEQSEWDRAAGLLLVEAAGGEIARVDGDFVASNRRLHGDVLDRTYGISP
ncbi:inositol monophosphatase family protein [Halosolutus amylolyticus]|uniref:Inositol monophosphatase family protein n=1 Tax=Halosolutus amylolyticus TaxID=2932267 RepID=A0ABD5PR71_9EURY|nr:inositol monophosphatase family protein [Halosolutus amylolyticus]